MLKLFLLAGLATVVAGAAQAQEIVGQWMHDATGEVIQISPTTGGGMAVSFARTGTATLTPADGGLKMNFSNGMFSSTDCVYAVVRLGKTSDRMGWTPKPGAPETCPRGAFSRFGTSLVEAKAGGRNDTPLPPPRPVEADAKDSAYGRPIRSADQVQGKWVAQDRSEIRVEKSIGGWVIWAEQEGQGSFVVGDEGAIQANFSGSGTRCAMNGRLADGTFILKPADARSPNTCPKGMFERVSR